jgi:hypothetical protein
MGEAGPSNAEQDESVPLPTMYLQAAESSQAQVGAVMTENQDINLDSLKENLPDMPHSSEEMPASSHD